MSRRAVILLLALSLGLAAVLASAEASASHATTGITASSLGSGSPTFVGPAATGCNTAGCSLLTGPFSTPSTANLSFAAVSRVSNAEKAASLNAAGNPLDRGEILPFPLPTRSAADPPPVSVSCLPKGPGCDSITTFPGNVHSVLGLDAVDSGSMPTNPLGDVEPPDQGLCTGGNYVVEDNNIGEILVYNTALQRQSGVIPLDTLMGLTGRGWSSGGDTSCEYDPSNGGHWFFTEIVSGSTEASGGPFTGCFVSAAACYEGIAVSKGSSPFGPYNVYFQNANYNPNEPGYPDLFNDFAKIGTTRDAFLVFYDEFPNIGPGLGFGFNGAQEFAFDKNALENGLPVTDPTFNVAIENMGLMPTPDGTCADDGACWYEVIPGQPASSADFDNAHGGSGLMFTSLDFFGAGDTRVAAFDWTDLSALNSHNCSSCGGIQFGGTLLSGVEFYQGEGYGPYLGQQKAGPIPLGDECGAADIGADADSCPEGPIATNGDGMTQVSQARGKLYGAVSTAVSQRFGSSSEVHQGAAYWVIDASTFDRTGLFGLSSQGYVSAAHEDLEFPTIGAVGGNAYGPGLVPTKPAVMSFTLSGVGGPAGADNGGFYPSSAYGRLTSTGLLNSKIYVAALGRSPQDGFTEYQGYPPADNTGPRWGDYGWAIYNPTSGKLYFASEYIPFVSCTGADFTLTIGTCGGTRDGLANWGTSVNSITP